MCGISGYIGKKVINSEVIKKTLALMKNRGPDANGSCTFFDKTANININLLLIILIGIVVVSITISMLAILIISIFKAIKNGTDPNDL